MYLKCNRRFKDGKEHRYWSLVESRRCPDGRVVQRPVLYLGEINDSQREAWIRSIEAFDEDAHCQKRLTLFASDREVPANRADAVRVRLSEFELRRPRQWGACWPTTTASTPSTALRWRRTARACSTSRPRGPASPPARTA